MSSKTSSTIGFERKHNTAATPRSRKEFIHDMNENLPQRPPNMYKIVERNRDRAVVRKRNRSIFQVSAGGGPDGKWAEVLGDAEARMEAIADDRFRELGR